MTSSPLSLLDTGRSSYVVTKNPLFVNNFTNTAVIRVCMLELYIYKIAIQPLIIFDRIAESTYIKFPTGRIVVIL